MEASALQIGVKVRIRAADDFFQFVDGWEGKFMGWKGGYPIVICIHEGIKKELLVPADQLEEVKQIGAA